MGGLLLLTLGPQFTSSGFCQNEHGFLSEKATSRTPEKESYWKHHLCHPGKQKIPIVSLIGFQVSGIFCCRSFVSGPHTHKPSVANFGIYPTVIQKTIQIIPWLRIWFEGPQDIQKLFTIDSQNAGFSIGKITNHLQQIHDPDVSSFSYNPTDLLQDPTQKNVPNRFPSRSGFPIGKITGEKCDTSSVYPSIFIWICRV